MVLPKTRTPAGQSPPSVLDEVASPALVIGSKKPLQAHVDGALLGQSATQLYSYFVFLWRVPIILTTNNWDCSGFSEADKNWLETNCVAVHIAHRVWKSAPTAPASAATSKRVCRSPQKQGDAEGRDWAAPMDED